MTDVDYKGSSAQTSFGRETTFGTKPTNTNESFGKVISCSIQNDSGIFRHRDKSSGRNVGQLVPGRIKVEGGLEYTPQNGLFLEYAFGTKRMGAKADGTVADDDTEVVSGCTIEDQTVPDMTVKLGSGGSYDIGGSNYTTTALATITITAAHATLDRVDIVSIHDNAGTTVATVTDGTPATSPVPDYASVPSGDLILALVYTRAATTTILQADIRHIFWIIEARELPSVTIEDDYLNPNLTGTDDIIRYFRGCKLESISYSVAMGQAEPVGFKLEMMGIKDTTNESGATASVITDSTAKFYLEWNTQIEIASGTNYDLNDFSFSIKNGCKHKGTNGRYYSKIVEGVREYSANAKIDLINKLEIERYYGASGATEAEDDIGLFTLKHTLKRANYDFIEFSFPEAAYAKVPISDPLDDAIQQELDIILSSCTVQLVDGTETYG